MSNFLIPLVLPFLFIANLNAEELIWFSLECNLRNSDIIVQVEIVDDKGNLKIEKYYKGRSAGLNIINLSDFVILKDEGTDASFPKAIGKKAVLFIELAEDLSLQPAFLSWGLSCLWLSKDMYWGLIQRENPGGYELYPYVESEIQLKLKVDNWKYLEASINSVNEIGSSVDRINYLLEIFKWHPFKHDILIRLSVEDSISTKQVQDLIWNIAANNYLTKSKLYDCPLLDYEEENYFQLAFRLFKRTAANKYEWSMDKIIDNLKSQIDYMAHKESTDVNEAFIIELLKFLKINPVSSWEKDVAELNIIINKNEVYYNHLFCAAMRNEINLN